MVESGIIYFRDGSLVVEVDNVRVYRMNDKLYLEIGPGHTLWALEDELKDYMEQLKDHPKGDCLEIGLGLGVASRYILTFPSVNSLTTVELDKDVIVAHSLLEDEYRYYTLDYKGDRHKILHTSGLEYAYMTKKRYDFIFIDFYDRTDEDTLPIIEDMARACHRILKPGGKMIGWLDKYTPEEFMIEFTYIFERYGTKDD
jgi:predicted membrane-bound spermidine synthase